MSCPANAYQPCANSTCLHNTFCLSNADKCNCASLGATDQLASRCQSLKRTFKKYGPFNVQVTIPTCRPLHIGFQFITQISPGQPQNYTLFYATSGSGNSALIVELSKSQPRLKIFETDPQAKTIDFQADLNKWQHIDLIVEQTKIHMLLNRCVSDVPSSQCSVSREDLTSWDSSNMTIYLGGQPILPNWYFEGCIKNLYLNNEIQSLYSSVNASDNGCAPELSACVGGCGDGGYCVGRLSQSYLGVCNCFPGFLQTTRQSKCSNLTTSYFLNSTDFGQWNIDEAYWNEIKASYAYINDAIASVTTKMLITSFRFRTTSINTSLIYMESTNNAVNLRISIVNSRLESLYRVTSTSYNANVGLSQVNVADGVWHSVEYSRLGPTIELKLDEGEGNRYNFLYLNSNPLGSLIRVEKVQVGANINTGSTGSFVGCLDDIRLFSSQLQPANASVRSNGFGNVTTCPGEPCSSNSTCSATEECIHVKWPDAFECRTLSLCRLPNQSCQNGGICMYNASGPNYYCNCTTTALFTGTLCQNSIVAVAGFQWWWILIGILLFLLLLLILGLIFCCCCGICAGGGKSEEALVTKKELETPSEKLDTYNIQGAGEMDYNGPLDFYQISPPAPNLIPVVANVPPPPEWVVSNESVPGPPPQLDYPLEYAFEGRDRSRSNSLSTIVSDADQPIQDGTLTIPPFDKWGPDFRPLTELYLRPPNNKPDDPYDKYDEG